MSLREKLKALEELQQIDLDAGGVRGETEGVPGRQAEIEAAVAAAKKAYEAEKTRLEDNERERRQIEALLQMERDKVKKWEGRLGDIKTPREYAALSREIDIGRAIMRWWAQCRNAIRARRHSAMEWAGSSKGAAQ